MVLYSILVVIVAATTSFANRIDVVWIPKYRQDNFQLMEVGARIAHEELHHDKSAWTLQSMVPERATSGRDQIRHVQNATNLNAQIILLSNNAGRAIENYTKAANDSGSLVVTYDSPLVVGKDAGESFHVAPVDFAETGKVMAEMALSILGDGGGDFVIMGSSRRSTNQVGWIKSLKQLVRNDVKYSKIRLVAGEVYYSREDNAEGYKNLTLEIAQLKKNGTYPDLSLIMVPSTSGAAAAAAALLDNELCGIMKVSGLGFPPELLRASIAGCAPQFALFDNLDLGYLAYHASHELASGKVEAKDGETVSAGRLGTRQIETDPYRDNAFWIKLGDFIKYDQSNVERASFLECIRGFCGSKEDTEFFHNKFIEKYKSKVLAIIPKFTGMISLLCSLLLATYILSSRKRRSSVFGRIMVGLSISDIFSSAMMFLSTWPMPTNSWLHWGAAGTARTCSAQGFFLQLGLCTATFYQATLLLYYFLTIVKKKRESQIKKCKIFFHLVPCTVGLGTSIAGLVLELYNPTSRGSVCWIAEYPAYCSKSLSCDRGHNAILYQWWFLYVFVCVTFLWLIIAMTTIFCKVHAVEKKSRLYSHSPSGGNSHDVAMQALFYCVSYSIPWIWAPIKAAIDTADIVFTRPNADDAVVALSIVNAVFFPLQGFFNFLIYLRPRYAQMRNWLSNRRVVVEVRDFFFKKIKTSSSKKQAEDVTSHEGNHTNVDIDENNQKIRAESKL